MLSPAGLVVSPQITSQPKSQTVAIGETVTLSVSATGGLPLAYQWWKGTEPLSGETNPALVLSRADAFSQGTYRVEVSNAGGSVWSPAATVTVLDPELTLHAMAALAVVGE